MCLSYITTEPIESEYPPNIGFKSVYACLQLKTKKPCWMSFHRPSTKPRSYHKWYTSYGWLQPKIKSDWCYLEKFEYQRGYHLWLDNTDRTEYSSISVKVEYKKILERGYEVFRPVHRPTLIVRKIRMIGLIKTSEFIDVDVYKGSRLDSFQTFTFEEYNDLVNKQLKS